MKVEGAETKSGGQGGKDVMNFRNFAWGRALQADFLKTFPAVRQNLLQLLILRRR